MESLALFVGVMLLSLLISSFLALGFSFIQKPYAKIITLISGLYSVLLGLTLIINADGGLNLVLVGLAPASIGLISIVVSFIRSRNIKAS